MLHRDADLAAMFLDRAETDRAVILSIPDRGLTFPLIPLGVDDVHTLSNPEELAALMAAFLNRPPELALRVEVHDTRCGSDRAVG